MVTLLKIVTIVTLVTGVTIVTNCYQLLLNPYLRLLQTQFHFLE